MARCRQQLFDPSSSKLFWFPERPRAHPEFHGGMLQHGAGGCVLAGQLSGPGDGLGPPTSGADDIAVTGNPPRARNLLDLVPTSTQPVDAARAAAAGATAQQPVGVRQAAELVGPADDGATLHAVDGIVMRGQGATGSDMLMDVPPAAMRALPTPDSLPSHRWSSMTSATCVVHK